MLLFFPQYKYQHLINKKWHVFGCKIDNIDFTFSNRMKKIGCILLLLSINVIAQPSVAANTSADIVDDVMKCFKAADTKELAKYFASTVSMSLRNEEGVYSKVQTEIILREFINRNTPKEISIVHRLDSNPNFRYVVFNMDTEHNKYRVSFKLISENSVFKMTELRIE